MARKSKSTNKMIAIALMVVGVGLAFWGYQMSGAVSSQFSQAFTGSASDSVMIRYITGAACFIAGLFILKR